MPVDYQAVTCNISPMVNDEINADLIRPFDIEEFRQALFQMHPDKAPGPDGFNLAFFQKFWNLLKDDLFCNCKSWLINNQFPQGLNSTNITLIPKCDNPATVKDLRPIA